jgi:hypothetical protein
VQATLAALLPTGFAHPQRPAQQDAGFSTAGSTRFHKETARTLVCSLFVPFMF